MTRFVLIDNHGEFHVKDGDWRADVGPEGPAQVRMPILGALGEMSGWVNDRGHEFPDRYPRNIVGGLVLTGFGANVLPYAGPVVITGWDPHGLPTEVCDLDDAEIATLVDCHTDARAALAGEPGPLYDAAREVAEQMRTAPTPTLHVLSADEFFARMRGQS